MVGALFFMDRSTAACEADIRLDGDCTARLQTGATSGDISWSPSEIEENHGNRTNDYPYLDVRKGGRGGCERENCTQTKEKLLILRSVATENIATGGHDDRIHFRCLLKNVQSLMTQEREQQLFSEWSPFHGTLCF